MQRLGLSLAVAALITMGAAAAVAGKSPVIVKDDRFSSSVTFVGPSKMINPFGGTTRTWLLRSWVNKSDHTVTHQLYVDTSYFWHWRFWTVAADDHAQAHPVEKINSSVDDCSSSMCSYSETVAVDLDDAFIRANASTGFQIKLTAQSGDDLILTVTPGQIEPVLSAIDTYLTNLPPAPPPPLPSDPGATGAGPTNVALGVTSEDLPPVLAKMIGRPAAHGALIAVVNAGSVAQRGGLPVGDIVTSYDARPITGWLELKKAVQDTKPGSAVTVGLIRGGKDTSVSLNF